MGSGGPTLVLVPGSCSTGTAWRPVIKALDGKFPLSSRPVCSATAQTAERRLDTDPSVEFEVEILERVVEKASIGGEAVHLVGHSFGGSVALLVAMRKRVPIASLTVAGSAESLPSCGIAARKPTIALSAT